MVGLGLAGFAALAIDGLAQADRSNWPKEVVYATIPTDASKDATQRYAPLVAHTEEFVLSHTEPVEASGFCIHYKLPHHVTFQSDLDRVRKARAGGSVDLESFTENTANTDQVAR
jgi:Bacterial phosphonate metabolism protein (PhnI)